MFVFILWRLCLIFHLSKSLPWRLWTQPFACKWNKNSPSMLLRMSVTTFRSLEEIRIVWRVTFVYRLPEGVSAIHSKNNKLALSWLNPRKSSIWNSEFSFSPVMALQIGFTGEGTPFLQKKWTISSGQNNTDVLQVVLKTLRYFRSDVCCSSIPLLFRSFILL